MKNKNDFINFYNNKYKSIIDKVFKQELKKYNNIKLKCFLRNLLFIILAVLFLVFIDFEKSFKIFILIFFLIIIVMYIIYDMRYIKSKRTQFFSKINSSIYYDMLYFITDWNKVSYYPNTVLDINDFNQMNLFNLDILYYNGKNLTTFYYGDKLALFCDVTLSIIKDKFRQEKYYDEASNIEYIYDIYEEVEQEVFNGLYYETIIERDNSAFIYLIPNNFSDKYIDKNINRFLKYKGKKVMLENLELNIKYEVFSFNEHQSRYMLTPLFMEKINELDRLIPNKKYIVFKEDGRVGIFIDEFSIKKLVERKIIYHDKSISREYLFNYFNDINKLVKINQILKYHK